MNSLHEQLHKESLTSFLGAIPDGVLIIDTNHIVQYVNREYLRIVQLRETDIMYKRLQDVRQGARLPDVVQSGQAQKGAFRREGDIEYVVDMSPIHQDGKIIGGISIVKDITEVRRLSKAMTQLERNNKRLRHSLRTLHSARYVFEDIVGQSSAILDVVNKARFMAAVVADVLITGESGTGKEVFAQAIHNASPRHKGPFIALNCATLAPSVIESELFGYADGAFTGALRGGKEGFFEVAEGGTLFLDEITELSGPAQAKLLRVLEERMVRRMGATQEKRMDVRVIASSNRDINQLVREQQFRPDLYFRLSTLHLLLPPLRERKGDIPLLAKHFATQLCAAPLRDKASEREVFAMLEAYDWPGNVRELRNTIEYAVSMSHSSQISRVSLPSHIRDRYEWKEHILEPDIPIEETSGMMARKRTTLSALVRDTEQAAIQRLLGIYGHSVAAKRRIAEELDISLATLYSKMR